MPEIDRENYPSNSIRIGEEKSSIEKQTPKKLQKVATGRKRKKGFLESFLGENAKSAGTYIIWEVLVPAAKKTILDMLNNGGEMILYGEARGRNKDRSKTRTSYTAYYEDRGRDRDRERDYRREPRKKRHDFDDIVLDTREEVVSVLDELLEQIDIYGVATVEDFYDLINLESEWTDQKYGWRTLRDARIVRVREGYILELPRPELLD